MVNPLNFVGIVFTKKKHEDRGYPIIHEAGPVMYTNHKRSYIVPESTADLLEKQKIQFKKVPVSSLQD